MSSTPKRKSETPEDNEAESSKRLRMSEPETGNDSNEGAENLTAASAPLIAPPDTLIDHEVALAYWSATEPSVNGVLGGFPQVSRIDLQGSKNFLAKVRRQSKHFPPNKKLRRAADCGAGIGRITAGLLANIAETVDLVEPVKQFTDQIKGAEGVGQICNVGLEAWFPEKEGLGPYDLIWNQWCVGQLKDAQLVAYLRRLLPVLSEGGWIVVKENLSNVNEDVFDATDSSVTRTDDKFRQLFAEAGLKVVRTELQKGMIEGLYPVRAYALQPK